MNIHVRVVVCRDPEQFHLYRQIYAIVGLVELAVLSFMLNWVFNIEYPPLPDPHKTGIGVMLQPLSVFTSSVFMD